MAGMTELQKFSDLPITDQEEVIRQYYETENTVKSIIKDFNLAHQPGQLVSQFPPIITQEVCPFCEVNLVKARESRNGSSFRSNASYCQNCGHTSNQYCTCENCNTERKRLDQALQLNKFKQISESFLHKKIEVSDFPNTLMQALALIALDRHSIDESYQRCYPSLVKPIPLGPTYNFSTSLVMSLFSKDILQVDHGSKLEAFIFNESSFTDQFYPMECDWLFLPLNSTEDRRRIIENTFQIIDTGDWPQNWEEEIDQIWRQITTSECEAHLHLLHSERHLKFEMNEPKTIDTIQRG